METQISKIAELNEYAQLLLSNGFTVIAPKEPSSYFHFSKDDKIGYVQYDRYSGATFSTVHKPINGSGIGTGFGISERHTPLTIENALEAFCSAPNWASNAHRNKVVKYKDIADFTNQPFHKEDRIFNA